MWKATHPLEAIEDSFSRALVLSLVFHLALVLIAILAAWIHPSSFKANTEVYHVSLVTMPAKNSESAAPAKPTFSEKLPQATIEQMKKPHEEAPKPNAMTIPDKKAVKPKKEEPLDKNLSKEINRIKQEVELERRIQAIAKRAEETRPGEATGKEASAGAVGGKESGVAQGYELAQYQDKVRAHVLLAWNLPKWTVDQLPKDTYAVLIVFIARDGRVLRTDFEHSSNISYFDQSAVRAVKRASPLPPPPDNLANEAEQKGLAMRFSPQKIGP